MPGSSYPELFSWFATDMTLIGLGASGTFPAYLLLSEGLENKGIYGDCGPDGEACIAR